MNLLHVGAITVVREERNGLLAVAHIVVKLVVDGTPRDDREVDKDGEAHHDAGNGGVVPEHALLACWRRCLSRFHDVILRE